jgi:K+ transporter
MIAAHGTTLLLWALMLGAGLLFGDGIITPAISVLSAVEGLQAATPALADVVVPITPGLLTALFAIQFKGTPGIGIVFGPVFLVWFGRSGIVRPFWRRSIPSSACNFSAMLACSTTF